ncbi:MAG TPA: biopolymer transporter ExbD [Opitutaceae bacterium]
MMTKSLEVASVSRKARVEIIPLIDVVFFLLATFVLFILSLDKLLVMEGEFPLPAPRSEIKADETLYLEAISGDMILWREGRFGSSEQLGFKELAPRLTDFATRVKPARVALNAGDGAKFGAVARMLDEVRGAKIKQVCIETAPPK